MIKIETEGADEAAEALRQRSARLSQKVGAAVQQGGQMVKSSARAECPVDTGRLRSSIDAQGAGLKCEVGANTEYAMYVEFGTCKMAARPYLIPAMEANTDAIVELVKRAIL